MSKPPIKTVPDLLATSPEYQKAIVAGKEHFSTWQYNVVDHFKDKTIGEIKQHLKDTTFPCAVMMAQIIGDFNFGSVIRTANNFNISKVYYFGNKHYDKRSAVGTYNYTDVIFVSSLNDIVNLKQQYIFVGLENNISGTILLPDFKWPKNSMLVLGEEGVGIPPLISDLLDHKIEIPSRGSVRSLNVASAASIALYDYYFKYV